MNKMDIVMWLSLIIALWIGPAWVVKLSITLLVIEAFLSRYAIKCISQIHRSMSNVMEGTMDVLNTVVNRINN